ncbi:MAG: glycosyltransferase [Actinobacteria bacterium 13_2_20CM_2_71_6]|nr:MAG: glycosyltransferase [Actinobacteria bacterium 13_2_20CM_2_71_6]
MSRVALVLASSTGGIGRHVASLAAGLSGRGAAVTVLGPPATQVRFDFTGLGARFVPIEVAGAAGTLALRRELARLRPDVIHAHGLRAGLAAGLARPGGVPLVVTWHNGLVHGGLGGRLRRLTEGQVARRADVLLGASDELVERGRAVGGRDVRLGPVAARDLPAPARDRAAVRAELGLAERGLAELSLADGPPLLLSVGRLHPHKGYDVLVEAAARWRTRTPAPVVAIAGTGPAYLDLARLISHRRAPVLLLGHRDDVSDLLGAADLALVTSVLEARQMFAQETLRAGVPLVATAVGGLPELVGDAAVLIPPRDVDALDAAVTALLDDPVRRAELARRGPLRAADWPTEAQVVDQIQALYAELTGQPAER